MEIDVLVDKKLEAAPDAGWLKDIAEKVLNILGVDYETELSIVITTQEKIARLNKKYLKRVGPTDVISFDTSSSFGEKTAFVTPPGVRHLGDVVISYPQAALQAEEAGHPVEKELAVLIIHGILHLLGFEDEKPELRNQMFKKQDEVLKDLGFKK